MGVWGLVRRGRGGGEGVRTSLLGEEDGAVVRAFAGREEGGEGGEELVGGLVMGGWVGLGWGVGRSTSSWDSNPMVAVGWLLLFCGKQSVGV